MPDYCPSQVRLWFPSFMRVSRMLLSLLLGPVVRSCACTIGRSFQVDCWKYIALSRTLRIFLFRHFSYLWLWFLMDILRHRHVTFIAPQRIRQVPHIYSSMIAPKLLCTRLICCWITYSKYNRSPEMQCYDGKLLLFANHLWVVCTERRSRNPDGTPPWSVRLRTG